MERDRKIMAAQNGARTPGYEKHVYFLAPRTTRILTSTKTVLSAKKLTLTLLSIVVDLQREQAEAMHQRQK